MPRPTSDLPGWLPRPASPVIFKYNPHQMPAADVLATLVGRDELLARLVSELRAQRGLERAKHPFLFGPRGIGKTTMLLALRHTIAGDAGLRAAFDVVQFSEEERRVANLPAFAIRALELLAEARVNGDADPVRELLAAARREPEEAMDRLLEAGGKLGPGRQALFLLDNLDDLLVAVVSARRRKGAGRKQLVAAIGRFLDSPHFRVVGTALQDPTRRKKDFPKELLSRFEPVVPLPPLPDALELVRKRAERDGREELLERLPRLAARIEGLNRLADGNPRLLVFLYDCLGERPLLELVELVQRTVDELTPMYQDVIDKLLNRGQAAVLEMLAARGGVGKAKEIAELTFQNEQTVRTFLGNLCDFGLVARADARPLSGGSDDAQPRETVFRTYPALFQIWYEMRHLHRDQSLYLVHFLSLLTEPSEARQLLADLRAGDAGASKGGLVRLMEGVVSFLDPIWEGLERRYVDEVLARGGHLRDALAGLDAALAETSTTGSQAEALGILAVRSMVRARLGDIAGARSDLELARERAAAGHRPEDRVKLHLQASELAVVADEVATAEREARDAIKESGSLSGAHSRLLRGAAFLQLARVLASAGDARPALEALEEAEGAISIGASTALRTRVSIVRGMVHRLRGDHRESRRTWEEALGRCREERDRAGEASSMCRLGHARLALGDAQEAVALGEAALAIAQTIGERATEANALQLLGDAHRAQADFERARGYYERVLAEVQETGDRSGELVALGNLGMLSRGLGDGRRAVIYFERALRQGREISPRLEGWALLGLARARLELGQHDQAMRVLERALAIFADSGNRDGEGTTRIIIGDVHVARGDVRGARAHHELALATAKALDLPDDEAAALVALGGDALRAGEGDKARELFLEARGLFDRLGDAGGIKAATEGLAVSLCFLTRDALCQAQLPKANGLLREALDLASMVDREVFAAAVVTHLVIPFLTESRELASQLLEALDGSLSSTPSIETILRPAMALVRFYVAGQSPNAFAELGPAEMVVVESLHDRIERPDHARARELLEAGRRPEAAEVLSRILVRAPDDVEALVNTALIRLASSKPEEAATALEAALRQKPELAQARLLMAEVEAQRGRPDRAIEALRPLTHDETARDEAFPRLATLLRAEQRFGELASTLRAWRETAKDPGRRAQLEVRIPEAELLAGELERARIAMPGSGFTVEEPGARLLLGLLRAFFALLRQDVEASRRLARATLELAVEQPPGRVPRVVADDLSQAVRGHLDERGHRFWTALSSAIALQTAPDLFAAEYLGEQELRALADDIADDGKAALGGLEQGKVVTFGDLLALGTRSIAPLAALRALGEAFAELPPARRRTVLEIFVEALERPEAAYVEAALAALGKNLPSLDALARGRVLLAILSLATRDDPAGAPQRDLAQRLLAVLDPHLSTDERREVRGRLAEIPEERRGPALRELLGRAISLDEEEVS